MRITIVGGFFLPMPPVSGGATEKSWSNLAREFAAQGHEVTVISRRWPNLPDQESAGGVRHLRLPGFDHHTALWQNLLLDFWWSWRVFFRLPAADIVVVNAVALPVWLGRLKPSAGRVVVMTGRMPKGQYRHYRRIARVLAASSYVRDRVTAENPALSGVSQVWGYPIDWRRLSAPATPVQAGPPKNGGSEVVVGYVGRIHEEKGLRLLADAVQVLGKMPGLPSWRLLLCGPVDVARGGSGPEFRDELRQRLVSVLPVERVDFLEPQFDEQALGEIYRRIDVFCYPSLAARGETFGVAVAEAMAAGAAPVVSNLACFTDFVRDGANGVVFDHTAPDAAARLAAALAQLVRDAALRHRLATAARADLPP
jgi:glycosyltransferase involved in cell wall biosynthesis